MEYKRAMEIMKTEKECVLRASGNKCSRDCANCDLLIDTDEVLNAYEMAIRLFHIEDLLDERVRQKQAEEEEKKRREQELLEGLGFGPDQEIPSTLQVLRALGKMMENKQ